jgi:hypothetical protein
VYLTPMAYSGVLLSPRQLGDLGWARCLPIHHPASLKFESQLQPKCPCQNCDYLRSHPRPRPQDLVNPDFPSGAEYLSSITEEAFSHVGPDCDPVRMGDTSHHTCECPRNTDPPPPCGASPYNPRDWIPPSWAWSTKSTLLLNHTSHHEWTFKVAFSSDNDETIADAVNVWIIGGDQTPPGSFVSYFAKRAESSRPFSPRLRQAVIYAIEPSGTGSLRYWDWRLFTC